MADTVLSRQDAALEPLVRGRTFVLKLGGSVGSDDALLDDVTRLQRIGARLVLVHGGGPLITSWLTRLGIETRFVSGLRFTDEPTLDVVRMVLGGLVNGEVVARIGVAGGRAVGLSGSDDHLLTAEVRNPEVGLVGEVTATRPEPIQRLLDAGYIVVVAPLATTSSGTFLNVNADTAASEVALALGADRLIFFTDVDGISGVERTPLRELDEGGARALIVDGTVNGGMIPKVEACIRALATTGQAQIVDGRRPHVLITTLAGTEAVGTVIRPARSRGR